jgi:hypothetical protein
MGLFDFLEEAVFNPDSAIAFGPPFANPSALAHCPLRNPPEANRGIRDKKHSTGSFATLSHPWLNSIAASRLGNERAKHASAH